MPTAEDEQAERLTRENLALAESVARRFGIRGRRDDDLAQVAAIGLWNAARRFDPARGTSFAAFAVPTISGEIKRHLRDHAWFIRPPRAIQDLRARVVEAHSRLGQVLGRSPSAEELAADLQTTASLVREAQDAGQHLHPASLDLAVADGADATLADLIPDGGAAVERAEQAMLLWGALRGLSARDRRIVHLRFFEDRTQQDIADEIGVTQMQISRILTKSLALLRENLEASDAAAAV